MVNPCSNYSPGFGSLGEPARGAEAHGKRFKHAVRFLPAPSSGLREPAVGEVFLAHLPEHCEHRRLDGQRQWNRRLWAGTRAPTQALFGTQAARALLSRPEGSPEQAAGLLEWWVAAFISAAVSQSALTVLGRLLPERSLLDQLYSKLVSPG